jgi:HK97 family phage portal protein
MFGYVKQKKVVEKLAPLIKAFQQQVILNQYNPGITTYGYNDASEHLNAYATVDDLYSVVKKIAKTCKRIPLYVYETKDEKALGKYRIIQRKIHNSGNYTNKSIWDLKELQTKALEIIGEQDQLQMVLDNPNNIQSKDEFYEAAYSFLLLAGNNYIKLNALEAGANKGKLFDEDGNLMYHLPPDYTFPQRSNTFPRTILSYSWIMGSVTILNTTDVIHRKYFNPIYDYNGNELVGLSPLRAAAKTLTQIGNERDYANRSLMNSGAHGFLTNEDEIDWSSETWGPIKEDLKKELGSSFNSLGSNIKAKDMAVIAGKWKYNNIGVSPADMQLVEQGKITFKKLCNVYGISDIWFNNDSSSTESNVKQMVLQAYTNCVLPEVTSLRDSLQKGLAPRYNDIDRIIDYDISDISELQEDQANISQRFASLPVFRPNDLFEALGFGKIDDPNADVVLIKQGYQMLSDITDPLTAIDPAELGALEEAKANDYK